MTTITDDYNLPYLNEIFDCLRRGRHLSATDGRLFTALRENLEEFQHLFKALGFQLEVHNRDFYYFRGKDSLSPQASRMAVFVFILIETLSDQGDPVVDSLMTRTFSVSELPHLRSARYRTYMKEAGATTEDDLRSILRQLDRFGFIKRHSDDSFVFLTPAYRFFDVCIEILGREETQTSEDYVS